MGYVFLNGMDRRLGITIEANSQTAIRMQLLVRYVAVAEGRGVRGYDHWWFVTPQVQHMHNMRIPF